MTTSGVDPALATTVAAPAPRAEPSQTPPTSSSQPALAYRSETRVWPWDVRIVIIMSIAWATLQLLQSAFGIAFITRNKNLIWFGSNYSGWLFLLGILLRALLPTLLVVGLIGLLKFKPGARRLSVLAAGGFVVFGILESAAQFVMIFAQRTYHYEIPGAVLGVVQNFITQNALLLILSIMLMRTDVRLLANDA